NILAKLKQAVKHWTERVNDWLLTSLHLFAVLRHVVWSDGAQELYVVITVVLCHFLTTGFVWPLKKHSVVEQKVVRHPDPVRLHGMALAIVVIPNVSFWNGIVIVSFVSRIVRYPPLIYIYIYIYI
uniref:Uncharacterized protein n=1 Tax=Gouania willdenowi TaxID=441366 RepID=A0A8C5EQV4_GOUWI